MKRNVLIVITLIVVSLLMVRYAMADTAKPSQVGAWRIVARDLDSHRWVYHDSLTFDACQAQRRAMLVPRPGSRYVKVRLCTPVGFQMSGAEAKRAALMAHLGVRVVRLSPVIRPVVTPGGK